MFGEPPDAPNADACTVTFSWLRSRFGVLLSHPSDEMVLMHARTYIWMLLSICLFGDKTGARAHVRWLLYLLRIEDLGRYSWGPQCLPGCTRVYAEQPTGMLSRWQGRWICCRVGFSGGFPSFALTLSTTLSGHWRGISISHIQREGAPTAGSQEAARFDALQCVRMSPVSNVGGRGDARSRHSAGETRSPLFGGAQNRPHPALTINFLHVKDRWGSDQWFPHTFQRWHALWATRFQHLFEVVQSVDPGPTADFIQWWILAAWRYLVPADRFHHLPPDEIPVEATQRQSGPYPARPNMSHVSNNRQPEKRMMVGTRTTARDWQWLDDIMAEDAPAAPPTQKIRRMPESYVRRRGAGIPRRGGRASRGREEGGDATPTQQTQGGASTSQAVEEAGTSSHAYLSPTPQTQRTTIPSTMSSPSQKAFLDGLSSPTFQHFISGVLHEGDGGYRPDTQFDGSQVHLDLNKPLSGPSHLFMALGGTPPSAAHVPGGSWDISFMEPARLPTPPAPPAPAE
ncbi:hypothetical protein PIB30_018774 [Stylosanthes scabra]|uniref:Aminotransferase-like plant mobile domain-containing protein n=1 Tax=Stylosanthes scabra TaxID=79078 RepID=A0ABU6Q812_9FABA|nr:hypothetical protein [Stylosanthes scabra]